MIYPILYLFSFLGSKFLGLERTVQLFRGLGIFVRRFFTFSGDTSTLRNKLEKGLRSVPFAAKCLDQAIVAWYILNLNGHPAILKIGLSLSPIESHAWVSVGNELFGDTYNLKDLTVVAQYPQWTAHN